MYQSAGGVTWNRIATELTGKTPILVTFHIYKTKAK